jgi:hypothetical protein
LGTTFAVVLIVFGVPSNVLGQCPNKDFVYSVVIKFEGSLSPLPFGNDIEVSVSGKAGQSSKVQFTSTQNNSWIYKVPEGAPGWRVPDWNVAVTQEGHTVTPGKKYHDKNDGEYDSIDSGACYAAYVFSIEKNPQARVLTEPDLYPFRLADANGNPDDWKDHNSSDPTKYDWYVFEIPKKRVVKLQLFERRFDAYSNAYSNAYSDAYLYTTKSLTEESIRSEPYSKKREDIAISIFDERLDLIKQKIRTGELSFVDDQRDFYLASIIIDQDLKKRLRELERDLPKASDINKSALKARLRKVLEERRNEIITTILDELVIKEVNISITN